MIARLPSLLLALAAANATALAQDLRSAIDRAEFVGVGRHHGVRPHGEDFLLHKVAVVQNLGEPLADEITVLEWKKVAFHVRPAIAATRLYCLHEVAEPARLGLPEGRYFKLDQNAGSHPAVDPKAPERDSSVRLARVLLGAKRSGSIVGAKDALLDLALRGPTPVRTEATRLFAERSALLDALHAVDLATLLGKAGAETEDIDYKLALATVCAERRMPGLLEGLCLTWPQIDDENFSRAVGRFARHLHGEAATEQLLPWLQRSRDPKLRGHVMLALGATSTDAALEALLRIKRLEPGNRALEAALRLHGAPAAVEAVGKKN